MKALLTILVSLLLSLLPISQASASTLPPCEHEDSINCHWDAETMGNGRGSSFENVEGTITYTTPAEAHTCADGATLTAERQCTFMPDPDPVTMGYVQATDGAYVAPEYLTEYEALLTPAATAQAPAQATQAPAQVTSDDATAWQLWDATQASNLLPDSATQVTYLGSNTVGYPLTADTIIVWDNYGNFYQFHIG